MAPKSNAIRRDWAEIMVRRLLTRSARTPRAAAEMGGWQGDPVVTAGERTHLQREWR